MTRAFRLRLSPFVLGPAILTACAGGGDSSDTTTARADTAAAPAAPQQPSVSYDVDPENVQAALQYDSASNTVTYPIVSGLTSANSAWNFNGYAKGNLTLVVPVGATVVLPFSNLDGNVPHSFGISTERAQNVPAAPSAQAIAFPGAATRRYETGLRATERDIVRFTADKAGRYLLICGVPGHAINGMWVRFEVSATAKRPAVRVSS